MDTRGSGYFVTKWDVTKEPHPCYMQIITRKFGNFKKSTYICSLNNE